MFENFYAGTYFGHYPYEAQLSKTCVKEVPLILSPSANTENEGNARFGRLMVDPFHPQTSLNLSNIKPSNAGTYKVGYSINECNSIAEEFQVYVFFRPLWVEQRLRRRQRSCYGTGTGVFLSGHSGTIQWQSSDRWSQLLRYWRPNRKRFSINTGNLTATTFYYRAKLTSGVCSSTYSSESTVTVSPQSVGGTAAASSTTICYNSATTH
jgi:hypothetical protein